LGKKCLPDKNATINIASSGQDIADRSKPIVPSSIRQEGHQGAMEDQQPLEGLE
jgi:hypothetical protein